MYFKVLKLIACITLFYTLVKKKKLLCIYLIQLCLRGTTTSNPKQSCFMPIKATKQQWSTQQWKSPRKILNLTSLRWCLYRLGWGKVYCDVYKQQQWTRGLPSLSTPIASQRENKRSKLSERRCAHAAKTKDDGRARSIVAQTKQQ
jgi:hypothetical protein